MKARIKWQGKAKFAGESGSGHTVIMDGPPDHGGENQGVRPMEMLLLGMGGCTAFDVVLILKRGRHEVEDCVVELEAERADVDPKIFTKIHAHYVITGKDLSDKAVARAVELSAEKYCSASVIMSKTAEITHDFEVVSTS